MWPEQPDRKVAQVILVQPAYKVRKEVSEQLVRKERKAYKDLSARKEVSDQLVRKERKASRVTKVRRDRKERKEMSVPLDRKDQTGHRA